MMNSNPYSASDLQSSGDIQFNLCIAGVLLAFMAPNFPTRDKVSFWVQD